MSHYLFWHLTGRIKVSQFRDYQQIVLLAQTLTLYTICSELNFSCTSEFSPDWSWHDFRYSTTGHLGIILLGMGAPTKFRGYVAGAIKKACSRYHVQMVPAWVVRSNDVCHLLGWLSTDSRHICPNILLGLYLYLRELGWHEFSDNSRQFKPW